MKTKFNEFINESLSDKDIDPIILNNFMKQLRRLKSKQYLQTIIGFNPTVTVEVGTFNKYIISVWYNKRDIFLEEPLIHEIFTSENVEQCLKYIVKFLRDKTINELLSNLTEMGEKKF